MADEKREIGSLEKHGIRALRDAPEELSAAKKVTLKAVKRNRFKADKEVVLEALKRNGFAF